MSAYIMSFYFKTISCHVSGVSIGGGGGGGAPIFVRTQNSISSTKLILN